MKKEINSKSKRKWVAGGLAAFASIALLTTGFATWVVGSKVTEDTKDVTVTVDTANNESVVFTADLTQDSEIQLKEGSLTEGRLVNVPAAEGLGVNGDSVNNAFLTLTGVKFKVVYGTSYNLPSKIKFAFVEPAPEETDYASVAVQSINNKFDTIRTGSSFSYLAVPEDVPVDGSKVQATGSTKTLEITTNLVFKWGNFFKGKTPAKYYNEETSITASSENYENITAELQAMYDQLNGQKLHLKASLTN